MSEAASLARRSARALGWSWLGALARALLQLLAQIALARLLGPQAFGQAAAALLVVGIGSLVAELGLPSALVQRGDLRAGDAGMALGWMLLAGLAAVAVIAALARPLAALLGDAALAPMVAAAAAIVPLQALANLPSALLQRRLQMKRLQAIQLLAYALAYGVAGVLLAWQGAGAWSLLAAYALHAALVGLMCWRAAADAGWQPRLGVAEQRSPLLGYGLRTTGANLVNWGIESVDRLIVSALHGPAALGPYSVAANLARAPVALLVTSAQPVAFAAAARLQDEHARLARGYLAMLSLALLAALPLFGFLAWHAATVVHLLYGSAWAGAAAPFAWLCAGVPFFVMLALTGPVLRGLDAVGAEARAQLAVLALLALALCGAAGQPVWVVAALVSLATALRAAGLAAALARRAALPALAPWRCWLGPLLLLVLTLGCCAALRELPSKWSLATSAMLAIAACAAALRLQGRALLGAPLALALHNRRGDSRLAALLCHWSRLA